MQTTPPSPVWRRKARYHHGDLRASALVRGREIVASHGPSALSLRGLARDLGVTAPALVYFFGSLAGLRAAVAESVMERAEVVCGTQGEGSARRRPAKEIADGWIRFAVDNANLYRLACGEGWHPQPTDPQGWLGGALHTASPRSRLEAMLRRQTRQLGRPRGDQERARSFAVSIHGLALARLDGVPDEAVAAALERALAA